MPFADGWICRVCWKPNRPRDAACLNCRTPRDADEGRVREQREAVAARSEEPEAVPDLVVALPAVVFRSYAKVWMRGGIGMFGLVALLAFSGATDLDWLLFTGVVCAGLVVFGVLAGEVSDGMRSREPWAFGLGLAMSLVAAFGSVVAFQAFAPGVVDPGAVRWGSVLVFGGAAVAAAAGLVLLFTHRRRAAARP